MSYGKVRTGISTRMPGMRIINNAFENSLRILKKRFHPDRYAKSGQSYLDNPLRY